MKNIKSLLLGPQVGLEPSLKHLRGLLIAYLACGVVEGGMHADIVIFLVMR